MKKRVILFSPKWLSMLWIMSGKRTTREGNGCLNYSFSVGGTLKRGESIDAAKQPFDMLLERARAGGSIEMRGRWKSFPRSMNYKFPTTLWP